jgi:hypothetical protein
MICCSSCGIEPATHFFVRSTAGAGCPSAYLSQIFTGKTAPGADVAVKVAQALQASDREQARIRFYAEGTDRHDSRWSQGPARERRLR